MSYTTRLTEQLALVATIDPDAYTAAAYTSDWVAMKNRRRAIFVLMVGDLGTSATVDFVVKEATDGSGTDAQTLKSATQLTQAGTDSDKQVIIEVEAEELSAGFTHLAAVVTIGTATSDMGLVAFADVSRYQPDTGDLASVDEIVT